MSKKYGYVPYSFCKSLKFLGVKQGITPSFYIKQLYGLVSLSCKKDWRDPYTQKMCDAYKIYDIQDMYDSIFNKSLQEKILKTPEEFSFKAVQFYESKRMATGQTKTP